MEKALENVEGKQTQKPVLFAPDFKREFIVQTDASDIGVGVILTQRINGEEHPILYLSGKFSGPEKRYSATERECAAIIFAIKKLRYYLDGQQFKIETDHNTLVWLKTNTGNNPRLMRWALALQQFNYTIVHRPGKEIAHVDCLSRL
ncbi:Retrovirus-related Pol polyprotein from transposon 17.6 [Araneus ventricosus]|uniref:Retrovirus-related Pol polyprotein from transposon 17.6 n=1 Tax=Araneus ventricosus TaxID=182803 RepID=A0A4Y2TH01_ARAVE|nr:Retrovirus-related Pol polyprotein from transposon 17.6 [Araneus ventricosus]